MMKPWIRTGAVIGAISALAVGAADPARAEDEHDREHQYAGQFGADDGYTLNTTDGPLEAIVTGIYPVEEVKPDGARTYRLDTRSAPHDTHGGAIGYAEHPWSDAPIDELARAHGIVVKGYPTVDARTLAAESGADLSGIADPGLVAYTGTQLAIWQLTQNLSLDASDPTGESDAVDAAVTAIADHLIETAGSTPEPSDEFTIEGEASWDGKLFGPFHFDGIDDEGQAWTNTVERDATAGTIVDENGAEKDACFISCRTFYVEPDDDVKTLTLVALATDSPKPGTLMLPAPNEGVPTMMLAETADRGVHTTRDITVGAGDDAGSVTGMGLTGVVGIGAALLVGGAALFIVRRRRTAESAVV